MENQAKLQQNLILIFKNEIIHQCFSTVKPPLGNTSDTGTTSLEGHFF